MSALFESVGDVWVIWAITLLMMAWAARHIFNRFRFRKLRRFHRCEAGATYSLPYVLTFPVFLIVMATFIQATLILMAKIGTIYAANNAARTYIVWQAAGEGASVADIDVPYPRYKVARAASQAMVPFASSVDGHAPSLDDVGVGFSGLDGAKRIALKWGVLAHLHDMDADSLISLFMSNVAGMTLDREAYIKMYRNILANANAESSDTFTSGIIRDKTQGSSDTYIRNKYTYAALATRVDVPEDLVPWNEDVEVKVTYRMRFLIPGTSRILGASRFPVDISFLEKLLGYTSVPYRDIETTVIMPSEAAKTEDGKVGIPYQPSLFVDLLD